VHLLLSSVADAVLPLMPFFGVPDREPAAEGPSALC